MSEVIVKGRNLIKKIDTAEDAFLTYVPMNGELVCVTQNDNPGASPYLAVGDGASTVNSCLQIGGNDTPAIIPTRLILTYTDMGEGDMRWVATGQSISSEYSQVCFETTSSSFPNSTVFSRCHCVYDDGDLSDTYTFSVWTTEQLMNIIITHDYEDDTWYVSDPLEADSFTSGDTITIDFYPLPQFPEESTEE